ncbi:MAG: RNA polymerase sigma factor [Planctomycetaceae bacterium]
MRQQLPAPEALVEHAAFLHRLAQSLLFDPGQAEEVVQEAMLAALEQPVPPRAGLRGWLAGVTRNLALKSLRGKSRRARRERAVARPEGLASTSEVAERLELLRKVAAAVHALEEPYRATVVHRYYDDRSPTEIARRLDLPVRTVETRLRRAIQRLRVRLDAAHGGERKQWCLGLLPAALLARSAEAGVGGGAALAAGATIVTTKATLAITALCAAAAFFAAWTLRPSPAPLPRSAAPGLEARLRASEERIAEVSRDLAAAEQKVTALETENRELRERLDRAPAAPAEDGSDPAAKQKGPRFVYQETADALEAVDWEEAGLSMAKIGPLLEELAAALLEGREMPASVGEIQRWNGPLVTMALTLQQKGVQGTGVNGSFTHPSVLVNLVYGTLLKAGKPLSSDQEKLLDAIGIRFLEEDRRRLAGYAPDALALRRLIEETALKDRLFAEVDAILNDDQRRVLHPPMTSGWTGLDLFSGGIVYATVARPLDFADRTSLAAAVGELVASRLMIEGEAKAAMAAQVQAWAARLPEKLLSVERDGLTAMMMMRLDHVRAAALSQLELFEGLAAGLALAPAQRKSLAEESIVLVPYLKKPS